MAIEALIGGALGGVLRLAPEIMKVWDRKHERGHELSSLLSTHVITCGEDCAASATKKPIWLSAMK